MEQNKENTKKFQIRIWYLTIFDDELKHPENVIYDLSWQQKSKNGKMFYHQILIFDISTSFNKLRELYPTAEIQKRKSIPGVLKTINNFKKDTSGKRINMVEIGKLPIEQELNNNNKNKKENNISKPKEELITVAELKNISNPKKLYFDEYDVWLNIHSNMNCEFNIKDTRKKVEVYYIFGPSGVGKTKKAYDIINNEPRGENEKIKFNKVSYNNYYWDGVTENRRIALYDDFIDDDISPIEFKHFIDYDRHLLNTQNGYIKNDYRLIIITSTQNPQDLFKDSKVDKKQWLSRITKIIDLTPKEAN